MRDTLQVTLYPDDGEKTFAVLDGAACEPLLGQLAAYQPAHACLYAGDIPPDLAACAPHLVELPSGGTFTEWLLANGFGQHWAIFVRSAKSLRELRRHFRTFLLVRDDKDRRLYFRFYDPRVLRMYLPTCNADELAAVFGPVSRYFAETDKPSGLIEFTARQGVLGQKRVTLRN